VLAAEFHNLAFGQKARRPGSVFSGGGGFPAWWRWKRKIAAIG